MAEFLIVDDFPQFRNPGEALGHMNLRRVRNWYSTHLGGTQRECAKDLCLSPMAVGRHVATLRAEWRTATNA